MLRLKRRHHCRSLPPSWARTRQTPSLSPVRSAASSPSHQGNVFSARGPLRDAPSSSPRQGNVSIVRVPSFGNTSLLDDVSLPSATLRCTPPLASSPPCQGDVCLPSVSPHGAVSPSPEPPSQCIPAPSARAGPSMPLLPPASPPLADVACAFALTMGASDPVSVLPPVVCPPVSTSLPASLPPSPPVVDASNYFTYSGTYLTFPQNRFALRARLNLLPTKSVQARCGKRIPDTCFRQCHLVPETLSHLLNHCLPNMGMIHDRHNAVLERLIHAIPPSIGNKFKEQPLPETPGANRPDLTIIPTDGRSAILVDVCIPFEGSPEALHEAAAEKMSKYEPLRQALLNRFVNQTTVCLKGYALAKNTLR